MLYLCCTIVCLLLTYLLKASYPNSIKNIKKQKKKLKVRWNYNNNNNHNIKKYNYNWTSVEWNKKKKKYYLIMGNYPPNRPAFSLFVFFGFKSIDCVWTNKYQKYIKKKNLQNMRDIYDDIFIYLYYFF